MSLKTFIVTEGKSDTQILERILAGHVQGEYTIMPASGYSSALSKAKTLLSLKNDKVILVLDTDSVNEQTISEKKDYVNYYIGNKDTKRFKPIFVIPEIEILLLRNKKIVEWIAGQPVMDELIQIGQGSPKHTLSILSRAVDPSRFLSLIDQPGIKEYFYKDEIISDIKKFIEAV